MRFDNGIWQTAWDVIRLNRKTVAIAILVATGLDLLAEYMGKTGSFGIVADLIIWSMVAFSAHGAVLLGSADLAFNSTQKTFFPFVWRTGVLLFLSAIPFLIALVLIASREGADLYVSLLMALPVFGLAALLIFAVLGTWLPAVVVGGDKRIGSAIGRAGRSFSYAAPRLLVGPGLMQTVLLSLIMLLAMRGILTGEVFGAAGFSLIDLISLPVIYAVRAFTVTLLAIILSRSYLIAEPARSASPAQAA